MVIQKGFKLYSKAKLRTLIQILSISKSVELRNIHCVVMKKMAWFNQ